MKKILITGASGFIGTRLAILFLGKGYHVTGLGRSKEHPFKDLKAFENGFEWISADTSVKGKWQDHAESADIIINLAGQNIFRYWTKKNKQAIYESRILTTKNIVDAMKNDTTQKLLTTSAVGIYGDRKDEFMTENKEAGQGFLADVCREWEAQGLRARKKKVNVAVMRLGVVLGKGGALSLMSTAFKFFVGGPLGKGDQWFPWIHIKDLENAIDLIVQDNELEGIFNFTGPTPVRQKQFAKTLAKVLHRPALMPAPSFLVRTIMGELGAAFLQSQRAIPESLVNAGYDFLFPDLDSALEDIFQV